MVNDATGGAWFPVWKIKKELIEFLFDGREALLDSERAQDEFIFMSQASTSAEAARAVAEQPRHLAEEKMVDALDFIEVRHLGPRDKVLRAELDSPIGPAGIIGGPRYTRVVAEAEAQVGG